MIIILRLTTGGGFFRHFETTIRPHLQQYFHYINQEIGNPPNLQTAQRLSDSLKIKILIKGPNIRWSSDGKFPDKAQIHFKHQVDKKSPFQRGHYQGHFVVRLNKPPYTTSFMTQKDNDLPSPWRLLLNTLLGILLVLGLLYFFLGRMISPLKHIQKSVKRIGSGELDHRIRIQRQDELGDLSNEINGMADDIENMLEAKRQLLLAISHELRSPITRAKIAISLMDKGHIKAGLETDLKEMEIMISSLLEAEQFNHRHHVLNLSEVKITELISSVIETHFLNQPIQQLTHKSVSIQPLIADEIRMQFVIKNVLENALKYHQQSNDEVMISSHQTTIELTITIEDKGMGIPAKHVIHLTEPFYRVDPSRHKETGGYGLGLYIVDKIIKAHQGCLKIESKEGIGTTVTIKIPVNHPDLMLST